MFIVIFIRENQLNYEIVLEYFLFSTFSNHLSIRYYFIFNENLERIILSNEYACQGSIKYLPTKTFPYPHMLNVLLFLIKRVKYLLKIKVQS